MVVSGLPERSTTHAQKVANQGLGMVLAAAQVCSPATGLPLQVRNGVIYGATFRGGEHFQGLESLRSLHVQDQFMFRTN